MGLLVGPASLAFAAENDDSQNDGRSDVEQSSIAAIHPSAKAEPLDMARAELNRATEVVERQQEEIRERRLEREAAEAEAAEAAAAEAAAAEEAEAAAVPAAPSTGAPTSGSPASPALDSIAACESGGDYGAVDPSGTYHGAYQFDQQTWESVGGSGSPSSASAAEQDARAQQLLEQSGSSPWPNCG
jgi:peptidoglycan endopeptidase LytE